MSSVVAGLAGIGKTELVLHTAHQAIEAGLFPGGVLFVDLQGYDAVRRVTPDQALDNFLRALGVDGQNIPPREDQRATLYRSMLGGRARMLIVLDNAASTTQVRPLLPGGRHQVVITSRHTLSGLDEADHLDVGTLSEAEATELVGNPRLAALCGRLPLALRIMRALSAADSHIDWVTELTDARHRLELLDDGDSRAVHAAFDLSYRSLSADQSRLIRLMSLHPTDEIALEGAAALADLSPARTRVLIRELARAHLVEPSATPEWYTFHDLIRLYAHRCAAGDAETREATAMLLRHYTDKASSARTHFAPRLVPDLDAGTPQPTSAPLWKKSRDGTGRAHRRAPSASRVAESHTSRGLPAHGTTSRQPPAHHLWPLRTDAPTASAPGSNRAGPENRHRTTTRRVAAGPISTVPRPG